RIRNPPSPVTALNLLAPTRPDLLRAVLRTTSKPMARDFRSSSPTHHNLTRLPSPYVLPSQPAFLTVAQLCARWQLGRKTVYKFITANALPAWKVGRRLYRIAVADVLKFEVQNKLSAG